MNIIYHIKNLTNNHKYIGSTVDFKRRKRTHINLLKKNKHHSRYLQNAWNLYGEENFVFEIIQEVKNTDELYILENDIIRKFNPEYNVMLDVFSHLGVKRLPEVGQKISKSLMGKSLSNEHKEKVRLANLGKKQSKETIEKRMVKSYKPIIQCDLHWKLIKIHKSATHAALELGCGANSIRRCLYGQRNKFRNFKWKYYGEDN